MQPLSALLHNLTPTCSVDAGLHALSSSALSHLSVSSASSRPVLRSSRPHDRLTALSSWPSGIW